MIDTIIDIHHANAFDAALAKEGGIIAVIHKATEGAGWQDAKYQPRRQAAKAAGLLWGCYHYASGAAVPDQVENLLRHAQPTDDELIALDWESSTDGPDMTLAQVREFARTVFDELGRWPCLYGGRLLREAVGHQPDALLTNCPLWYPRYATAPIGIPTAIWPTYTLWQFTDGNVPVPTPTPGTSGADRNRYQGTEAELRAAWPLTRRPIGAPPGPGAAHLVAAR